MTTRIVFMGSPEFALPSLRALAAEHQVVGVVTQPDRPAGRGRALRQSPVKALANELGLPLIQPAKLQEQETQDHLRALRPDLIVTVAFGQILRTQTLDLPPHGCLNVHASLLPRWRGAAPIQAAILAGDGETGVTIMKMDEGLDSGPIVSQRAIAIEPEATAGSLAESLSQLGAALLSETLPRYLAGAIVPQAQPTEGATVAPKLSKGDGLLDLKRAAAELTRRVRAFHPSPGAFLGFNGEPLKVCRAHEEPGQASIGARLVHHGWPALGTASGLLVLDEVQPAGKKSMSGRAFLTGARTWAPVAGR